MKIIDGKESNRAKEVNVATEFNEFKETLFNKKIIRHKVRRIQCKKNKMGTYEISSPSIETYLAVVRGLPTKKFLPECVNEKSSTERRS